MTNLIIVICVSVAFFVNCSADEPFKLDEFIERKLVNKGWNGKWISDNSFIYTQSGGFYKYDVETNKNDTILSKDILDEYIGATIELHPDNEKLILIKHDVNSVFRHSKIAKYTIYDSNEKDPKPVDVENGEHLQYCRWGPGTKSLIYVIKNNIRYKDYNDDSLSWHITDDGKEGEVYNGIPDWVYEEEVLSSGEAMWLSPDGQYLAFAQFTDSQVKTFPYIIYGNPSDLKKYPTVINLKYPKVGENNPIFKLKLAHLGTIGNVLDIPLETTEYSVLFGATWLKDRIMVLTMNRVQNEGILSKCAIDANPVVNCILEKKLTSKHGWLYSRIPIYSHDEKKMLQVESGNGYAQLILSSDLNDLKKTTALTNGPVIVTKIHGFSKNNNIAFFEASFASSHYEQQVYSYDITEKSQKCLTCELLSPDGRCRYATADFSQDMSFVAFICQGPGPTVVRIEKFGVKEGGIEWENNQVLRDTIKTKSKPLIKDFEISRDGYTIKARLLLPPNFNATKKYPMLINVYGGPQSNQIKETFSLGFEKYLVTNREYIYAFIDGRGSGRRGDDLMYRIYRKLGTVEIEDQIIAAKELSKESFVDSKRIGIWGWSYGGFATAWAMVKDTENVFKCGLSVAPVTNFIYYDSIYTERYMGLLDDNEEGYNNTDVTRQVASLKDKQYFLIHGNADDNVHYQQSMLLARALELADVPFKQMSYPDEDHGLQGVYPHLYHSMDTFWKDCFSLKEKNKENRMNTNIPSIALTAIFIIITKLF